jgi:hypothetical protein
MVSEIGREKLCYPEISHSSSLLAEEALLRHPRLLIVGLFLLLAVPGLATRAASLAELAARNDIAAIARLGPAALPELARLYQAGSDEQKIRIAGIFNSLGQSSRAAELALLADAHTPNVELRVAVQYALGRVSDDPAVVDTLLAILRNDANPIFRDHAGCALANDQVHLTERKRLRLYEGLIGTLSHPKRRVQNTAIAALEVLTGQTKGFRALDPPEVKQRSIEEWKRWLAQYRESL